LTSSNSSSVWDCQAGPGTTWLTIRSLYKTFSISPIFLCFTILMYSTDTSNWIYVSCIWYVLVSVRHYIFSITSIIKNYNRCLCVSVSIICHWFGI
jgi:hypothetical protein